MDFDTLRERALTFREWLLARKDAIAPTGFDWYPYDTMASVLHLDTLLSEPNRSVFGSVAGGRVADIGAADGDLGFFLEAELGCRVDLIDNAQPNFNKLAGAGRLVDELDSECRVHDVDLDSQFSLPAEHYDAVLMLGLLYHLKNPFYVMETLARRSALCFVSTRIAQVTPDHRSRLEQQPVAYLLDPSEANNDDTNYWIFSRQGLVRLFERTGWEVADLVTVGCRQDSDPSRQDRDERAFALLRSRIA
ncbi:2-polyprenyl-3-methyl-5-hydroxy-6-metoxy-1,4-benzoquinol methylase [Saccharopolyspora lacisalsi]|uniref:2-polyprenyl-3-methyl-5-hydroxy-6-metoxy-1, 4-benzoquinol methylase n=1 Tax=Halosaccharopolyspora lacisalsi TaxID=1000566 RepID=A0A839E6D7_9PSEU|nr:methyltransferase domain-containing protein [Halosaccharopolyspora lacisalsi]MBA8827267.1 2-polyprenyl-3-methyl-5-hydroxy-6-metoxy-1,4-benzoquinol methylase [Halosaccharopolyspora lacisalsi]